MDNLQGHFGNPNGSQFHLTLLNNHNYKLSIVEPDAIADTNPSAFLDIYDIENPIFTMYTPTNQKSQEWIILPNLEIVPGISATSFKSQYGTLHLVPVPFNLLSFNLGYYVTLNQTRGSEKAMVENCQKTYDSTKGMSNVSGLSQCTKNALDFILNYSHPLAIIGLQEFADKTAVSYLLKNLTGEYDVLKNGATYVLSLRSILGPGIRITPEGYNTFEEDYRPFTMIWYNDCLTLGICLHAPHVDGPIIKYLEKFIEQLEPAFEKITSKKITQVATIILMGDLNQDLADSSLFVFGKELQVYYPTVGAKYPKTCCYPNFLYAGDLIFTSEWNLECKGYFGIPPDLMIANKPMSDHLPVVSYAPAFN